MKILVNDAWREVVQTDLQAVLRELGYESRSIATAVNSTFVPQSARVCTELRDGDRVEIVAPMQGG